jgi:hypothetical protein
VRSELTPTRVNLATDEEDIRPDFVPPPSIRNGRGGLPDFVPYRFTYDGSLSLSIDTYTMEEEDYLSPQRNFWMLVLPHLSMCFTYKQTVYTLVDVHSL